MPWLPGFFELTPKLFHVPSTLFRQERNLKDHRWQWLVHDSWQLLEEELLLQCLHFQQHLQSWHLPSWSFQRKDTSYKRRYWCTRSSVSSCLPCLTPVSLIRSLHESQGAMSWLFLPTFQGLLSLQTHLWLEGLLLSETLQSLPMLPVSVQLNSVTLQTLSNQSCLRHSKRLLNKKETVN